MTDIAVYIPTTNGASQVLSLTKIGLDGSDRDYPSMIGVNHTTRSISGLRIRYDEFVREPTGVIERHTDHRSYRVDVSGDISHGDSWQLGLFIAHALAESGAVGLQGDRGESLTLKGGLHTRSQKASETAQQGEAGIVVWATGIVTSGLHVRSVGEILCKLDQSADLFEVARKAGARVVFALPAENRTPELEAYFKTLSGHFSECDVVFVDDVVFGEPAGGAQTAVTAMPSAASPGARPAAGTSGLPIKAGAMVAAGVAGAAVLAYALSGPDETTMPAADDQAAAAFTSSDPVPEPAGGWSPAQAGRLITHVDVDLRFRDDVSLSLPWAGAPSAVLPRDAGRIVTHRAGVDVVLENPSTERLDVAYAIIDQQSGLLASGHGQVQPVGRWSVPLEGDIGDLEERAVWLFAAPHLAVDF